MLKYSVEKAENSLLQLNVFFFLLTMIDYTAAVAERLIVIVSPVFMATRCFLLRLCRIRCGDPPVASLIR